MTEAGIQYRKAEIEDGRYFTGLINSLGGTNLFRALFGQYNYTSIIEYSYLTLIAIKDRDVSVGFASFNDGFISNPDNISFEYIIEEVSQIMPCRATNTLLLNFWAINGKEEIGIDILRNAFATCPEVNYILWVCSPSVSPPDFMNCFVEVNMSKRQSILKDDILAKKTVYVIHRSKILPQLLVRDARVEDNDDLLPILQSSNPDIAYGREDFFLADLIQSQDNRNKFFVGVYRNRPVGMLATSLDINADLLSRVFDLSNCPGLIIEPESTTVRRNHVTLLVGDQNIIDQIDMSQISKLTHVNVLNAATFRANDEGLRNSFKMTSKLTSQFAALSVDKSKDSNFIVVNYPISEQDAKSVIQAARNESMIVDCVVEVVTVDDDNDLNSEDDHIGGMLDGIEMLRESFMNADPEDFPTPIVWKKIGLDVSERSSASCTSLFASEYKVVMENYRSYQEEIKKRNKKQSAINAFAISLFSIDESFESRSEDLIKVAFEEYNNIEYCVLMVPNSVIPSSSLIHWMHAPSVRDGVSFDQSLYIIHRQALLAQDFLSVERISSNYLDKCEAFISQLPAIEGDSIRNAITRALRDKDVDLSNNPAEVCFLSILDDDVVGVLTLSRKSVTTEDIALLRAQYELDDYISFERHRGRAQAMISNWIMNPIFGKWGRFVLREAMRRYGKTLIYHHGERGKSPGEDIIYNMIPVGIRKLNDIELLSLDAPDMLGEDYKPASSNKLLDKPLHFISKRQLFEPKTTIGKRIVIVGGTTCAFSILEKLCLSPNLNLLNIYLVLETPLSPWVSQTDKLSPNNYSGCLSMKDVNDQTEEELCALGLPFRTTLVQGRLTDIDRKNKAIVVSNDTIVEYDVLVLSSHVQDISYKQFATSEHWHPLACAEKGLFCMGNFSTDEFALSYVNQALQDERDGYIVVYGTGAKALCILGNLEKSGIDSSKLMWITTDAVICEGMHEEMRKLIKQGLAIGEPTEGIATIKNAKVLNISLSTMGMIANVTILKYPPKNSIMGPKEEVVKCFALFCCSDERCDVDTFSAVNDSGLVYDGGIVVDENFRTTDPCIHAVGPISRYSRKHSVNYTHDRCNNREIGSYVGNAIINIHLTKSLDNFELGGGGGSTRNIRAGQTMLLEHEDTETVLPVFRIPKIFKGTLPGGLFYFHSSIPENDAASTSGNLTTGPVEDFGYRMCTAKINQFGVMSQLTYVTSDDDEQKNDDIARNIGSLVGWHESFLNSATYSFEMGNVIDWIEFFSADWATALKFDRMPAMCDIIRTSVYSDKGMISILDKVMENAESTEDDDVIAVARRKIIGDRGSNIPDATKVIIVNYILDFMRRNKSMITKYYLPPHKK